VTPFSLAMIAAPGSAPEAALLIEDRCYTLAGLDPDLAGVDTKALLGDWDTMFPRLSKLAEAAPVDTATTQPQLLAPVLYPDALLAVGGNYKAHLKEMGLPVEKWATMPFFCRPVRTTLVGPGETVRIPRSTKQFDWECELAVVIGRTLRHASREEAMAGIAGYAIGLDLSCRDLIKVPNELGTDLIRGKGQDTMAPCGPAIRPAAFVDPADLHLQLWVNGERMMDARTSDMLFKCDEMIATISEHVTLRPGDICFTGSPSGSAGVHGDRWLRDGDTIRAEIEQVGVLEVTVRDDV
jgi:2,4-didehydro-3-deoxy-L-rhamnonate hydrolase